MLYKMENMSLEDKIGQLLMVSIDGLTLDHEAAAFLDETHAGNVILFGNNADNRTQVAELTAAFDAHITARCGIPPVLGTDHEGGNVNRFREGVTFFPSAMAVGATGDIALVEEIGRAMGEEMRALGLNANFAPVLDVNTNPRNPVIGLRAYGDDPHKVAAFGVAMMQGLQSTGLMACGKHFPGHGDTAVDSHLSLPKVDRPLASLEEVELVPYKAVIKAGIAAIMTSHILFPQLDIDDVPATMSSRILQRLLRRELGFEGLIVADGMQMRAIARSYGLELGCVEAVRAGVNLLCVGTGGVGTMPLQTRCYYALLDAVSSGDLPLQVIDDSVRRILAAKEKYCTKATVDPDWAADEALARRAAEASMTWLRGAPIPLAGRVVCASIPTFDMRYGVSEGNWRTTNAASALASALGGEAYILDPSTDFAPLAKADTVVLVLREGEEVELRCLYEALRLGKPTVVVISGLPYLADKLPPDCPILCTYGENPPALAAACRVLRGELQPTGKSPVRL